MNVTRTIGSLVATAHLPRGALALTPTQASAYPVDEQC
jgi:hypothetical protein